MKVKLPPIAVARASARPEPSVNASSPPTTPSVRALVVLVKEIEVALSDWPAKPSTTLVPVTEKPPGATVATKLPESVT